MTVIPNKAGRRAALPQIGLDGDSGCVGVEASVVGVIVTVGNDWSVETGSGVAGGVSVGNPP